MENQEPFKLNNLDEVIKFNNRLTKFMENTCPIILPYIDIEMAYKKCLNLENGGKLFSAILDLKINFTNLYVDSIEQGKLLMQYNEVLDNRPIKSCLDDDDVFYCKFRLNHSYSNFIIRYRAFFDKFMGILIMILEPNSYEKYLKAKSRKKEFGKILANNQRIQQSFIEQLFNSLDKFDNTFRTPEVHGTGFVRKWSFTLYSLEKTPLINLFGYWNYILPLLKSFDDTIRAV